MARDYAADDDDEGDGKLKKSRSHPLCHDSNCKSVLENNHNKMKMKVNFFHFVSKRKPKQTTCDGVELKISHVI